MTKNRSEKAENSKPKTVIKITAVIFSMVFTLILLEIAAQVWLKYFASDNNIHKYGLYTDVPEHKYRIKRHHYLNYCLTPNFKHGMLSHNSLGFRGEEFSPEKPDSVFRIVALGGSTTYTVKVNSNNKTYPALLEKILNEEYGYKNAEVINAGVPGYNSWESLINLQFRVLDLNPDLILIYHGTNDVHPRLVPKNEYKGDNSGGRKDFICPEISVYDRSALLRIIQRRLGLSSQIGLENCVSRFHHGDKNKYLEANPPKYFERNLTNIIAIAQRHNIGVSLATWASTTEFEDYASKPVYQKGYVENNEVVKRVGAVCKVPVFDFEKAMPKDKEYWGDGRHVNEKGARLKAELFAKHLHETGLIPQNQESRIK